MDADRFERAIAAIDAANAEDPHREVDGGEPVPKEWLYGRRMSAWLERLRPDAPEPLRLAARAQHIRRWEIPRATYPMDRPGYLRWRRELQAFHAETAGRILAEAGYGEEDVARVGFLLQKKQLAGDADTQSLEDAACLVFLEYHIDELAAKTEPEKMASIIRKTWKKMSNAGHEAAMGLTYSEEVAALIARTLG